MNAIAFMNYIDLILNYPKRTDEKGIKEFVKYKYSYILIIPYILLSFIEGINIEGLYFDVITDNLRFLVIVVAYCLILRRSLLKNFKFYEIFLLISVISLPYIVFSTSYQIIEIFGMIHIDGKSLSYIAILLNFIQIYVINSILLKISNKSQRDTLLLNNLLLVSLIIIFIIIT